LACAFCAGQFCIMEQLWNTYPTVLPLRFLPERFP
jgi:hypothetical protein